MYAGWAITSHDRREKICKSQGSEVAYARARGRVCVCVCACQDLPPSYSILWPPGINLPRLKTVHTMKQYTDSTKGLFTVKMWYALQCNFTQAHKRITAFSEPIFMKLIHSEQQYGQISDTKLSQNWLRNVENTHKDSLTSFFRTAWLSLCRILLNLINALNLREEHLLYQISSKLENKCSKMGKVSCTPLRKVCLSWTVLHGSHNCSLTLFGDPPYRNSPISAQKYGKQRTNSCTPLRKVWLSLRRFSWNSRVLENVCYSICIPIS